MNFNRLQLPHPQTRRASSAWWRCSSTSRQPQPPRADARRWGPSRKDSTPTA